MHNVLPASVARSTVNFKKKNKSYWGNYENWLFAKSKCKVMIEWGWSCLCLSLSLCFSIEHLCFKFSSVLFKSKLYGKKWRSMNFDERKKGGRLVRGVEWKTKKMNTHKRVWLSEAATAEGWKELVFHFCVGRN